MGDGRIEPVSGPTRGAWVDPDDDVVADAPESAALHPLDATV